MPFSQGKKNKYFIDAGLLNSALIKTKLLPMAYYDIDSKQIVVSAENIVYLKDFFTEIHDFTEKYNLLVKMISDISKQLFIFNDNNIYLIGLDFNDIIVIDNSIFVIHNDKNWNKGNKLLVPFKKPLFCSPSVLEINKLPSTISATDAYYSLALLVIYYLQSKSNNETINISNNYNSISTIKGTKMYYFLERAINDGILLYI